MKIANKNKVEVIESIGYKNENYEFCIANSIDLKECSFRFMYNIYTKNGLGLHENNEHKLWFSKSELLPNTITLLVLNCDNIVGSVSIIADSEMGLPVDNAYKKNTDKKRNVGCKLCEVFSLGLDSSIREKWNIMGKLFNHIYIISRYIQNGTHWMIEVMPKHESFYRHYLLFYPEDSIGYHKKTGVYCKLLSHRINIYSEIDGNTRERTFMKYYYPHKSKEEIGLIKKYRDTVSCLSVDDVEYFLKKKTDIVNEMSLDEKKRFYSAIRHKPEKAIERC